MSLRRDVTQPRIRLADRDPGPEPAFPLPSPEALAEVVRRELGAEFELYREVGRGKLGTVYFARDVSAAHPVALKVFPRGAVLDVEAPQRFERAAERAATLDHPHIVPILRAGVTQSLLWYSAEYVDGRSLGDAIRHATPMPLRDCLRLAEQVASALHYAHRRGVVHGNLNPSTVFVDGAGWVRLREFGVRRAVIPTRPVQAWSAALQAPAYLAPESLYHQPVEPNGDQYSLAVLVHECLTGGLPYSGETPEELARQHATDRPTRLRDWRTDIPAYVDEAVQRALDRTPSRRFGDVLEFMAALDAPATPSAAARAAPRRPGPVAFGGGASAGHGPVPPELPPLFAAAPPSQAAYAPVPPLGAPPEYAPPPAPLRPPPAPAPVSPAYEPEPVPPMPAPGLFTAPMPGTGPMPGGLPRVVGWPGRSQARQARMGIVTTVILLLTVGAALVFRPGSDAEYFAAPDRPATDVRTSDLDRSRPDRSYEPPPVREHSPPAEPEFERATPLTAGRTPSPSAPQAARRVEPGRPSGRPTVPPATPPRATAEPASAPGATGRLVVSATPWGRVYVDGRLIGESPVLDHALAPGTHSVLIVREGYEIQARTISVAPGEVIRLTGIVLKESAP